MSANVDSDTKSAQPSKIEKRPLSAPRDLPNVQNAAGASEPTPTFLGFTLYKADPMPNQTPTWTCVERTPLHLSQDELSKMVQKRANKRSAALQYESVSSNIRRAHINQLIDEHRCNNPLVQWTCVYVKEVARPSKARNARRGDYETISMVVIIMQRPMKSSAHARSPMGDIVDLGRAFQPESKLPSIWPQHVSQPVPLGQNGNILRSMAQIPCQLASVGNLSAGKREPLRELTQSTATITDTLVRPVLTAADSGDMDLAHTSDSESSYGSSSDSDSASTIVDQSDDTSMTDDSDSMDTETENCMPRPNKAYLRLAASPRRREASRGPSSRHGIQSRGLERRHDKSYFLRDRVEATLMKSSVPKRTERARSRGSASGKRYKMHLIDDNEARSRMLDYREASIGQREKMLKRTFSEVFQLECRQPVKDTSAACRCTCRCAIKKRETV
ncbi:hypothetical protein N7457_004482 [Penicillium paradoxum]|uniref:uncharacterized protein n=1 Tax=Penicillium paradoxum TaxID=176176 RepID=UPI0025494604|nr:uncharacterized protein N7457_004482 [Penicillium paradoxum]KAJ5782708.1 hypothetical protein N7457_004482 [Penicillium paradoxum]